MSQFIAVYVRVSTNRQDTRSQEPDLQRWISAFASDHEVKWFRDTASGTTMERPSWRGDVPFVVESTMISQVITYELNVTLVA